MTRAIRQVAQFLWVGPGLSPLESLCLKSFLDVGYDVHLYCYRPLDRVPPGVTIKNAGEIIPESEVFMGAGTSGGSYAPFADRFRYHLLHARGGWWFDIDHVAIRLLPEPNDLWIASQWEGPHGEYPCVGAIWSNPGDPRMGWLKDRADLLVRDPTALTYTSLGPVLMNELVDTFSLQDRVAPWWEFNAYPYYFVERLAYRTTLEWLVDKLRFARHLLRQLTIRDFRAAYIRRGTRALHLSNEVWRVKELDKSAVYHPGSIYGQLQRRHGFDPR